MSDLHQVYGYPIYPYSATAAADTVARSAEIPDRSSINSIRVARRLSSFGHVSIDLSRSPCLANRRPTPERPERRTARASCLFIESGKNLSRAVRTQLPGLPLPITRSLAMPALRRSLGSLGDGAMVSYAGQRNVKRALSNRVLE